MFERKTTDIKYSGKTFTVQEYSVASTINLTARIRRAKIKNEDDELLSVLIDMILTAVTKPKLKKEQLLEMSQDDLIGLCTAACKANGFMPGEALQGKKPKKRRKKS